MRRLSGYLGLAELEPESKSPPAPLVAAPAPAAAAGAPDFSLVSDPAGGYAAAVGAGSKKAQASAGKVFGLGILAGTQSGVFFCFWEGHYYLSSEIIFKMLIHIMTIKYYL